MSGEKGVYTWIRRSFSWCQWLLFCWRKLLYNTKTWSFPPHLPEIMLSGQRMAQSLSRRITAMEESSAGKIARLIMLLAPRGMGSGKKMNRPFHFWTLYFINANSWGILDNSGFVDQSQTQYCCLILWYVQSRSVLRLWCLRILELYDALQLECSRLAHTSSTNIALFDRQLK